MVHIFASIFSSKLEENEFETSLITNVELPVSIFCIDRSCCFAVGTKIISWAVFHSQFCTMVYETLVTQTVVFSISCTCSDNVNGDSDWTDVNDKLFYSVRLQLNYSTIRADEWNGSSFLEWPFVSFAIDHPVSECVPPFHPAIQFIFMDRTSVPVRCATVICCLNYPVSQRFRYRLVWNLRRCFDHL